MRRRTKLSVAVGTAFVFLSGSLYGQPEGEIGDGAGEARFVTSRSSAPLEVPSEEPVFTFVVFGDRTGGPPEGIEVLKQAVQDANLIDPDLVMTVGDLIQGYNERPEWMSQMREFKRVMDGLEMPWYPVAGNHDIYWRGDDPPVGEHESDYEEYFGPLWYAFRHKDAWFIVLYSDEGDPKTGVKAFNQPAAQRMSDEQLDWLESTLELASEAQHTFVFLHHPRWLRGGYGDDWDRVHETLVTAGNVRAVFAGHIHRMRHDGVRDGIEYVTLATVGGGQSGAAPAAGYLHQFHLVSVRPDGIALASIPVGEVLDVRRITGAVSDAVAQLSKITPEFSSRLLVSKSGACADEISMSITNPIDAQIDATVHLESGDSRWRASPDHHHITLAPGETRTLDFAAERVDSPVDSSFRSLDAVVAMEYVGAHLRIPLPIRRFEVPLRLDLPQPARPAQEMALALDGVDDYALVPTDLLVAPDGPLTVEGWLFAESFGQRVGLLAKTENSEFGVFASGGAPSFSVFLDGRYAEARASKRMLELRRWTHVAGVFDGGESRLYVDGELVATAARAGKRLRNALPFLIGADVNGSGNAMSHFHGQIDGVRVSSSARYAGDRFEPARRPATDDDTLLLLNMDGPVGGWLFDESAFDAHAHLMNGARVESAAR
ncbi:MAG: LamG-like jellyroll fold domain-containing protein [Phycisphaerales bacterium]